MAGVGLVEAGSPQPARHALSAYPRGGAAEAGRRLGLLRPHCLGRATTTAGAASVQHPADARDGVKVRLAAVSSVSRTFTTTLRSETVSAM